MFLSGMQKKTQAALFGLALCVATPASSASEFHDSETLQLNYGVFNIHGSYSKHACSAQANLKSRGGKMMGFSIYWKVGKTIYLLVSHPNNSKVSGKQQAQFVFPNGKKLTFPMRRNGNQLQVRIGFGGQANDFYKALKKNSTVRIELPAVGDSVDVSLKERERLEAGMELCRRWQK